MLQKLYVLYNLLKEESLFLLPQHSPLKQIKAVALALVIYLTYFVASRPSITDILMSIPSFGS